MDQNQANQSNQNSSQSGQPPVQPHIQPFVRFNDMSIPVPMEMYHQQFYAPPQQQYAINEMNSKQYYNTNFSNFPNYTNFNPNFNPNFNNQNNNYNQRNYNNRRGNNLRNKFKEIRVTHEGSNNSARPTNSNSTNTNSTNTNNTNTNAVSSKFLSMLQGVKIENAAAISTVATSTKSTRLTNTEGGTKSAVFNNPSFMSLVDKYRSETGKVLNEQSQHPKKKTPTLTLFNKKNSLFRDTLIKIANTAMQTENSLNLARKSRCKYGRLRNNRGKYSRQDIFGVLKDLGAIDDDLDVKQKLTKYNIYKYVERSNKEGIWRSRAQKMLLFGEEIDEREQFKQAVVQLLNKIQLLNFWKLFREFVTKYRIEQNWQIDIFADEIVSKSLSEMYWCPLYMYFCQQLIQHYSKKGSHDISLKLQNKIVESSASGLVRKEQEEKRILKLFDDAEAGYKANDPSAQEMYEFAVSQQNDYRNSYIGTVYMLTCWCSLQQDEPKLLFELVEKFLAMESTKLTSKDRMWLTVILEAVRVVAPLFEKLGDKYMSKLTEAFAFLKTLKHPVVNNNFMFNVQDLEASRNNDWEMPNTRQQEKKNLLKIIAQNRKVTDICEILNDHNIFNINNDLIEYYQSVDGDIYSVKKYHRDSTTSSVAAGQFGQSGRNLRESDNNHNNNNNNSFGGQRRSRNANHHDDYNSYNKTTFGKSRAGAPTRELFVSNSAGGNKNLLKKAKNDEGQLMKTSAKAFVNLNAEIDLDKDKDVKDIKEPTTKKLSDKFVANKSLFKNELTKGAPKKTAGDRFKMAKDTAKESEVVPEKEPAETKIEAESKSTTLPEPTSTLPTNTTTTTTTTTETQTFKSDSLTKEEYEKMKQNAFSKLTEIEERGVTDMSKIIIELEGLKLNDYTELFVVCGFEKYFYDFSTRGQYTYGLLLTSLIQNDKKLKGKFVASMQDLLNNIEELEADLPLIWKFIYFMLGPMVQASVLTLSEYFCLLEQHSNEEESYQVGEKFSDFLAHFAESYSQLTMYKLLVNAIVSGTVTREQMTRCTAVNEMFDVDTVAKMLSENEEAKKTFAEIFLDPSYSNSSVSGYYLSNNYGARFGLDLVLEELAYTMYHKAYRSTDFVEVKLPALIGQRDWSVFDAELAAQGAGGSTAVVGNLIMEKVEKLFLLHNMEPAFILVKIGRPLYANRLLTDKYVGEAALRANQLDSEQLSMQIDLLTKNV